MEGIAEEQLPPMGPGLDQDDAQGVQVQVSHHAAQLSHCQVIKPSRHVAIQIICKFQNNNQEDGSIMLTMPNSVE